MTNQQAAQDGESPETELDELSKSERELDLAISELRDESAAGSDAIDQSLGSGTSRDNTTPNHPMRRDSDRSVIMSIPVAVDVVLGTTEMPVHELMALKKGSTVTLDRQIGEPVDLVVSGRHIAKGEIVILEDDPTRFGIKLTDLVEN